LAREKTALQPRQWPHRVAVADEERTPPAIQETICIDKGEVMKQSFASFVSLVLGIGFLGIASPGHAAVEYVRICSLYGAAFYYIPGTDICLNDRTGDARQQTVGGTWRSLVPYPEGKWVTNPVQDCAGRLMTVGNFASTDFALNAWDRKETEPFRLTTRNGEFISKVVMSGGFFDPRIPNRHGANGTDGFCVRSVDPNVAELQADGTSVSLPYGNGNLPIGCVANSRIVNMTAAYSIAATSAYPNVDSTFLNGEQTSISGPYVYGSSLVVTTDLGPGGPTLLTYFDATRQVTKPLSGRLSVSVCVEQGATSPFGR
jgi:hypothetical protein